MRWFPRIVVIALAVVATVSPASAVVAINRTPMQRAASADVVTVGKVTAIEKDSIEVNPLPGATKKVAYKIAVVKVIIPLAGADNLTHVKVGFIPGPASRPQPGLVRGPAVSGPQLKEGDEFLFFLTKHPDGGFYAMSNMNPPIILEGDEGKKTLESVKKITTLLADPMKGLKSESPDERFLTAAALITRYRTYPAFTGVGAAQVPIPVDESQMILKALLKRDWVKPDPSGMNPTQLFFSLGLNDNDGWKTPKPQQGTVFNILLKDEFEKWLDGPGKEYCVKKLVPKK